MHSIPQLVELVHAARDAHPDSETEGYGSTLPGWLAPKEQLIWNTIVCAIYGPIQARPLLTDELGLLPVDGKPASTDVITDLAEKSFARYLATRRASGVTPEFNAFAIQPDDLRNSGLERIESIPDKLKVLGYRIVPATSCYPEQRIESLRASEVECLAILEHRRWFDERTAAGWKLAPRKDIEGVLYGKIEIPKTRTEPAAEAADPAPAVDYGEVDLNLETPDLGAPKLDK
jgi:hypothetical protein